MTDKTFATKKIKNIAVTSSLFLALLLIAASPFLLIAYQRRAVIGRIVSKGSSPASLDGETLYFDTARSLWERILLTENAVKLYSVTEADTEKIAAILDEELFRLGEFDAIPILPDDAELLSVKVTKQTYIRKAQDGDGISSEQAIALWEIVAEYDTHVVYACIDTDTHAVCDITITSRRGDFLYPAGTEGDAFIEYLKSVSPIPDTVGTAFSTGGYCGDVTLRLYIVSTDIKTGAVTDHILGSYAVDVNTGDVIMHK